MERRIRPFLNQGALWSKRIDKLDPEADKAYIINHTLCYGSLEDIKNLSQLYPFEELKKTFLKQPLAIYSPASFNFVKNILLGIKSSAVKEANYVKAPLRNP